MEPLVGDTVVTFEPTVSSRADVSIRPKTACLMLMEYWPVQAPPNMQVNVFVASFTSITFR